MKDEFDPLTGEKLPKTTLNVSDVLSDVSTLSASDLSRLDSMSREELLALVQRMARQCGLAACRTKEEIAEAMLDVLAETALKPLVMGSSMKADIQSRMQAIDRWLDRDRGKPAQTVQGGIVHMTLADLVAQSYEVIDDGKS